MIKKCTGLLMGLLLISSCAPILPTQETPLSPQGDSLVTPSETSAAVPALQLPASDEIVLTIPNAEPFSGREGEARPNWLGWGAETFVVLADGGIWIDDTAATPNRLLHYSPQGKLLQEISLEGLVVYPYDLAVTQNSLWLIDVSAQPPKIVQLDMDGTFRSSIEYLKEINKRGGQVMQGELFSLCVGEQGELLLETFDGYYEMIDAAGQVSARPLDVLSYYGHTYRAGPFDEATNRLPIFVDGKLLDMPTDFFVEMPFLGFQPDGRFALAGWVEDAQHQIDRQVRYYGPTGELLGLARQRPPMFYKDWNHYLAYGPNGAVYQLVSHPDHSVQILRLGFADALPPLARPIATPTALTVLQPPDSAVTDEEQARHALLSFFSDLSAGKYEEAAARFSGEEIDYAREPMPGESPAEYWEYICSTLLWCLPIAAITETKQVAEDEFLFYVVFRMTDGTRFEIGACCGGDPAASPPVWQFAYPVKKIDGTWKVMREPLFTP